MFNEANSLIAGVFVRRPMPINGESARRSVRTFADWRLPMLALLVLSSGCGTLDRKATGESPLADLGPPSAAESSTEVRSGSAPSFPSAPGVHSLQSDSRTSLNVHLFGLSYHPDRQGARERQLNNELNAGLGLSYEFQSKARLVLSAEGGFYKDSGSHWAKFVGVSYQYRLSQRWRLGADLLLVQSPTYNQGNPFVAPIPHLSVDLGAAKINAIYIPKVQDYDVLSVLGVYLSIPLKTW